VKWSRLFIARKSRSRPSTELARTARFVARFVPLIGLLGALTIVPASASAVALTEVGNFDRPTFVTSDPGDPDRLFVVEQRGRIQLIEDGSTTTFLDIRTIFDELNHSFDESGLWSMAFSPDYASSELFYVAYSGVDDPDTAGDESGDWHIAEFEADDDTADAASRRDVLTVEYPPSQYHYGGQLQFGSDGYLYASIGDGGPNGDPAGNAQNLSVPLGKIVRIDPRGAGPGDYTVPADNPFADTPGCADGCDEIWSYGLRNPWRFSFDRLTGDLVIGDVGFDDREEVDFETGPDPGRGANFGWNCREGTHQFSTVPPCDATDDLTEPTFEYQHLNGSCAITGGYVVRDRSLGDLYGRYLYADFCVGELRSLDLLSSPAQDRSEGLCLAFPISFGEDSAGRIYVTSLQGAVYRLTDTGATGACPQDVQPPPSPESPPASQLPLPSLPSNASAVVRPRFARTLSLSYSAKRPRFRGRLASPVPACTAAQQVALYEKRKGTDLNLGSRETTAKGAYRLRGKEQEKGDEFYAEFERSSSPGGTCLAARSKAIKVG
jgi:glucose/arabinose dehydrogenase